MHCIVFRYSVGRSHVSNVCCTSKIRSFILVSHHHKLLILTPHIIVKMSSKEKYKQCHEKLNKLTYSVTFIDETIGNTSSLCTNTDEFVSKKAEEYGFEK